MRQNISFARNFKGRLYQIDQQQQQRKKQQQQRYRKQLQIQIQQDLNRKKLQKAKLQQQEAKRQQKFYEGLKIQAQVKNVNVNNKPNYFVIHSSKGKRSLDKSNVSTNGYQQKNDQKVVSLPKIIKRGGYHNQSSLDQSAKRQIKINKSQVQTSKVEQKDNINQNKVNQQTQEQTRIKHLLLMQQNMMQKLNIFKNQIINSKKYFSFNQQVQNVRIRLRSKAIDISKILSLNVNQGIQNIFINSLPYKSKRQKIYEGSRQARRFNHSVNLKNSIVKQYDDNQRNQISQGNIYKQQIQLNQQQYK